MRLRGATTVLAIATLVVAACGSSSKGGVSAAQARVSSAEKNVADAQAAFEQAKSSFCTNAKTYITAIDRYGKVFDQSAATVGDIKTAGADLENPRQDVTASAQHVVDTRESLSKAKQDLVDAQNALKSAQAEASSSSTSAPPATASTTTTTLVPAATVDRVKKAEQDLTDAAKGITDQTPLVQATAQFNSAALALEAAWLRVFADAGCLTEEQQQKAEAALTEYTTSLQTALQSTGYYTGKIDGVYGPATADAVKKLQTANGLPATGFVDRATAVALSNAMASKGGAIAANSLAHTAAVQSTLKLAGFWTGPVDGHWTPELTDALKAFQTHLGIPATGSVDAATLAAIEATIANAKTASTTTTAAPATTTSPTSAP
jgi:peptidoglycan hydrolase-like protein with peptidoglycan-binding domain